MDSVEIFLAVTGERPSFASSALHVEVMYYKERTHAVIVTMS